MLQFVSFFIIAHKPLSWFSLSPERAHADRRPQWDAVVPEALIPDHAVNLDDLKSAFFYSWSRLPSRSGSRSAIIPKA